MIVIREAELGIPCDNTQCTTEACYVIVLHADSVYVRMYCPACTRRLTQAAESIMRLNDDDRPLDDVLEVDQLLTGGSINA